VGLPSKIPSVDRYLSTAVLAALSTSFRSVIDQPDDSKPSGQPSMVRESQCCINKKVSMPFSYEENASMAHQVDVSVQSSFEALSSVWPATQSQLCYLHGCSSILASVVGMWLPGVSR